MLRYLLISTLAIGFAFVSSAEESVYGYEIVKVNHELLDKDGNTHQEIGDLKSKAKYQNQLEGSENVSGLRFLIHWATPHADIQNFIVKLETRGLDAGSSRESVQTWVKAYPKTENASGWAILDIKDDQVKRLGKLMAWKVTLLENSKSMATRKSFLWDDSLVTSITHPK